MSSLPTGPAAPVPDPAVPDAGRDWTAEVTDRVGALVETVRTRTTVPITKVARAVVFGLVVATGALVALVLAVVAVLRVLDVYLPFHPYGRRVWVAYAVIGGLFLLLGAFCWSKRSPAGQEVP